MPGVMRSPFIAAWAAVLLLAGMSPVRAGSSDAVLAQFFSIWDDDAGVTPQAVASLYGRRVGYYGEMLSNAQVYANKRAFIRRWPDRRYAVVPGTVRKRCDRAGKRCAVAVTLAWHAASPTRAVATGGLTRVSMVLAAEDGELKITREVGRPVARDGPRR